MSRFHVNPETGEAGQCKAQKGGCPFGTEGDHHDSIGEARQAYEAKMGNGVTSASDEYRDHAAFITETLYDLHVVGENETYDGSTLELHEELRELNSDLVEYAESYRLRATDEEEKAAWGRTAAKAAMEQAAYERSVIQLTPRDSWESREAYRTALAEAQAKEEFAKEAYLDVREQYFESPWQESKLAGQLHEEWAEARNREPRMKPDGQGGEVDIANTAFLDLPYKWQEENLLAGRSALAAVIEEEGNVEFAAVRIHRDWLSRNGEWAEPHQKRPYHLLSEEEKEKDRVLARAALKILA